MPNVYLDLVDYELLQRNWYALIPIVATKSVCSDTNYCMHNTGYYTMISIVGDTEIPTDDLKHAMRSIISSTQDEY